MVTFGKTLRSVVVIAALTATSAFGVSNISATKHNLAFTGGQTIKAATGENNDEICVYCHTPHAANTAFTGAPLWNKATPTTAFTMYGTTIAGTATDSTTTPNSPSMACLSCHDGVSAINSMVNAPGSGGYTEGGANRLFQGSTTAFVMPATGVTNIGTNLANDHPVSISYTAGKAGLRATTADLVGTWAGATKVSHLLRGALNDKVECGSCHDPHEATNATFLRVANAGSALCIGCHAK